MNYKRFAHGSAIVKGQLYVLGGFTHKDAANEQPQTIPHVEKFNNTNNSWEMVNNMNECRAFFACCTVDD